MRNLPIVQGSISHDDPWTWVSIKELSVPRNGRVCYCDYYWIVHDGCVLFYEEQYPQCNQQKEIMEYMWKAELGSIPNIRVELIPCLFLRRNTL
jgi:hypothetical protein